MTSLADIGNKIAHDIGHVVLHWAEVFNGRYAFTTLHVSDFALPFIAAMCVMWIVITIMEQN